MIVRMSVTHVGTCPKPVECRMDTASPDARTDSGEEPVLNNVTVRMEIHVIRVMDHVSVVSLKKVYFFFYLKTVGQFCFLCIVIKNAYFNEVPIIEDDNFLSSTF